MKHTTTELRVGNGKNGEPFCIVSKGRMIALVKTCGNETNGNAHLLAKAFNSYSKHFGDNAVKAAEDDWIGRAVELLVSFANDDPCAVDDFRSDEVLRLLSLTKARKP